MTKLSFNDDIKIDWDEKHLVVFHFFRSNVEKWSVRSLNLELTSILKLASKLLIVKL